MDLEKKWFGKWWMWILSLILISSIIFAILSYIGLFTKTVIERKVFENSYQYSEAKKTEIATYEAQLAELQTRLNNLNLDDNTCADIEAQISAIKIQLETAKRRE